MKSDLEVRQDVERELAWDPRIDAANIAVAAKQGVVTLTGQVRNFIEKWEAEDAAKPVRKRASKQKRTPPTRPPRSKP